MLYVTWQCECLLHCEHGCSVDVTRFVQQIAVGYLVMREVGSAVVCVVILCLHKTVLMALLTLCLRRGFKLQNPPCRIILKVLKYFEVYGISCHSNTKRLHTIADVLLYLIHRKWSTYIYLESDTTRKF